MRHGPYDHELVIGTTTERYRLAQDETGKSLYEVTEEVPRYRNPLRYEQTNWIGGHGQHRNDANVKNDMYFEGQSIDTTQEGRVILGPLITEVEDLASELDSAPVKFFWFEYASKWLCSTTGGIYVYDGTDWDVGCSTATNVTDFAEYENVCYAARGQATPGTWASGDKYYTSTNGADWTITDLTDGYANKFCVSPNSAGTAEVLWKAKVPNEVSNTTDGTDGGTEWSTPAYIGDISTDITNIFTHHDRLLIGKTSGLFHYDSDGGVHPLRKDLETNQSTDNFKYVAYWQAGLYFSEIDGMGEITGYDAYEPMGPFKDLEDISKRGDIVGITADKDWIYVATKEVIGGTTYYYIYKGRERRVGGRLRWEWCSWIYLGENACATIAVCQHSATDRRLWFGYGTHTGYVILSDNPTADSAARFCAAGWVRMSYDYGTEGEWDKLWQSAVLEVVGGTNGETVQIQQRADTATSPTSCIAAATTSGLFETNFASALSVERIQFEIHLASNTNTATPEVSYFQAKGVEKPVVVRFHEATYVIGDEPTNRAKTLRDLLRTGRTTTTLIKFADLRYHETTGGTAGTDYVYCVMEPGWPREVPIIHTKGRAPELGIQVRLREVSFS